jgi:DNA-binding CsgD family transcriptional regulator
VKAARKLILSDASSRVPMDRVRSERTDAYIFCDKKSGVAKFTVDAEPNGELPLDRVAGLLAVYCVAHYCSPRDLVMVVRADEALRENISVRAAELLARAHVGVASVALSPREREVLRAVTNNLGNKEIAFQLSISVRTVKFHVSALLAKFGVSARAQLCDYSTARMYDRGSAKSTRVESRT